MTAQSDILAIGVHPDDIELCCSGTLLRHRDLGYRITLCDLTRGELGSRGTPELRLEESEKARQIFGFDTRENLELSDGFLRKDKESLIELIKVIRKHRPKIVLGNAVHDRHPDHSRAADFIREACFLSGLIKIKTELDGQTQQVWRPNAVYHYVQDYYIHPDLIVDITDFFDEKMRTIKAYGSQFYDPDSDEVETPISTEGFLDNVRARAVEYGRLIGVKYAEGFTVNRPVGVSDLLTLA